MPCGIGFAASCPCFVAVAVSPVPGPALVLGHSMIPSALGLRIPGLRSQCRAGRRRCSGGGVGAGGRRIATRWHVAGAGIGFRWFGRIGFGLGAGWGEVRRLGAGERLGRCRVLGCVGDPLLVGRGCGCRVGFGRKGVRCRL